MQFRDASEQFQVNMNEVEGWHATHMQTHKFTGYELLIFLKSGVAMRLHVSVDTLNAWKKETEGW